MAGRAGAFDGEEALCGAHAARALTGRAGLGAGAGLGARTGTDIAGDGGGNADLGVLAAEGFLQRDFHVVAQVRTAFAAAGGAPLAPAAHHLAEDILEDVGEAAGTEALAARTAHAPHATFEGSMAIAVIGSPLLRVLQRLIGLVDFLERRLSLGIARVLVRVILHGELAKSALQLFLVGCLRDAENFVKVTFHTLLMILSRGRPNP